MSAPAAAIAAEGLEVRYHGGPDPAVRDASLRLAPGEGLLVCGAPGAGKTSLVRGLLGLVPAGGRVSLFGGPPEGRAARGRVGYGPQGGGFAGGLRVDETARAVARLRRAPRPARAAAEALERAGLAWVTAWPTARLDAEGHRRLSLALAIAGDPDLVVLDEPWALTETIDEIRRARARGAAVLATNRRPAGLAPALGRRATLVDGVLR